MSEQSEQLKGRTMRFAVDVARVIRRFPAAEPVPTAAKQAVRAATSIAANYRAACRSRSHNEFVAKIGLVAEESDETQFWLEFAVAAELVTAESLSDLQRESTELVAIFSRAHGTARINKAR